MTDRKVAAPSVKIRSFAKKALNGKKPAITSRPSTNYTTGEPLSLNGDGPPPYNHGPGSAPRERTRELGTI